MAKYLYGTVRIDDFDFPIGEFMVVDGELVLKDYTQQPQEATAQELAEEGRQFKVVQGKVCLLEAVDTAPTHEITEIELPDGAIPMGVFAPYQDDKDGCDVLAYIVPIAESDRR